MRRENSVPDNCVKNRTLRYSCYKICDICFDNFAGAVEGILHCRSFEIFSDAYYIQEYLYHPQYELIQHVSKCPVYSSTWVDQHFLQLKFCKLCHIMIVVHSKITFAHRHE